MNLHFFHALRRLGFLTALSIASAAVQAQAPLGDLLLTAGTTTTDSNHRPWAYVTWQATNPDELVGRVLAIYSKAGLPETPGDFRREAIVTPQKDPRVLAALISRAAFGLGENLAELAEILNALLERAGVTNAAPPAEKLAALLTRAPQDAPLTSRLRLLAAAHPSVAFALGTGWAGSLDVAHGAPVTFELRELDPKSQAPRGVVGRVTLRAGLPEELPAPGAPVQIPEASAQGDLNIKLRWATPPPLARLSTLSYGFNVWRLTPELAAARGFDKRPPTRSELFDVVRDQPAAARRVNDAPVLSSAQFTELTVSNFAQDSTNYFIADDNGRYDISSVRAAPNGVEVAVLDDASRRLHDGDRFVYFVTARDLLGRDGLVSPGGPGIACRRLPPPPPRGLRVENDWNSARPIPQQLKLTWLQNTHTGDDFAERYFIYRGENLGDVDAPGAEFRNQIAEVAAQPGLRTLEWLDSTLAPGPATYGHTYWYAVRAVREGKCAGLPPTFSGPEGPAFGTLRQREGPPAATGGLEINCPRVAVAFETSQRLVDPAIEPDDAVLHYRLIGKRRDREIAAIAFSAEDQSQQRLVQLDALPFAPDEDEVTADLFIPRSQVRSGTVIIECVAYSRDGRMSNRERSNLGDPPRVGELIEGRFVAGLLTLNTISSSDPLGRKLLDLANPVPFVSPAPDTNHLVVATLQGRYDQVAMLVQVDDGRGWRDLEPATATANDLASAFSASQIAFTDEINTSDTQDAFLRSVAYRGLPILKFDDDDCLHIPRPPSTDRIVPTRITIRMPLRAREWRLYRRINDGELTLVAQGEGRPGHAIQAKDDAMPVAFGKLCYYVQVADEHGNPSPLTILGCTEVEAPLPKPILAAIEPGGTAAAPTMKLRWFCPPAGVERFQLHFIPGAPILRELFASVFTVAPKRPMNAVLRIRGTSQNHYTGPASTNYLTGRVGGDFGAGPDFDLEVPARAGVKYTIAVAALNAVSKPGEVSEALTFVWEPPIPKNLVLVPWPARPAIAPTSFHPGITAVHFRSSGSLTGTRPRLVWPTNATEHPVGIRIGTIHGSKEEYVRPNGRADGLFLFRPGKVNSRTRPDFNEYLYTNAVDGAVRKVLPAVLYRQQVANSNFPAVTGDLIQASPLVEKIAWERAGPPQFVLPREAILRDPFIGVADPAEPETSGDKVDLYLLDTQPVIRGATYHYWLVRFAGNGEVAQVIDAGEIALPVEE